MALFHDPVIPAKQDVSDPDAILTEALPEEPDHAIVTRLDGFFRTAVNHQVWRDWRTNASKCYRYLESDQWTEAELKELAERGQPPTIRNEIKPIHNRVHGQFLQTRVTASYVGRNTPVDDQAGQVYRDLSRHVDQRNSYEFHESQITSDGLAGGLGVLEMGCRYNELGQKEVYEGHEDPFVMFPDPYFRKLDLSDAKFVCRAKWADLDDCIAAWPDKEMELRQLAYGHGASAQSTWADYGIDPKLQNESYAIYIDAQRKRLRPVECWYRRKVRQYWLVDKQGITIVPVPMDRDAMGDVRKTFGKRAIFKEEIVDRMYLGVFCANVLLAHDLSPYRHNRFPFLFFMADRKKNGEPLGLVYHLIPIQDAINKRESKALNMLSNRRIIAEKNVVEDPEQAQIENAKADGYIEVREGALSQGKIVFPDNQDIANGQVALLQEAKGAMPRVSGISDESMGFRSEVRSGRGIQRKQMMTGLITSPMSLNLKAFRTEKAKLQFDLIKETYTAPMTFMVTDDPNAAKYVQLTQDHITGLKERIYDIVITESPDYMTVREEQLDMLFQLMPQVAGNPWMMRLAISMSELRDKDALLRMLDQASQPPPVEPNISVSSKWEEMTGEEKAFFAMRYLQMPELAQFLAKQSSDPAFVQKIKASLTETKIREGTRASLERGRVDLQAMQTAMEGLLESRQQQLDQDNFQTEQANAQGSSAEL